MMMGQDNSLKIVQPAVVVEVNTNFIYECLLYHHFNTMLNVINSKYLHCSIMHTLKHSLNTKSRKALKQNQLQLKLFLCHNFV